MDKRLEIRCSEEQLVRWRAAVPGGVPFASWVRAALEDAAGKPAEGRVLGSVGYPPRYVSDPHPMPTYREFRPDFKGGKK